MAVDSLGSEEQESHPKDAARAAGFPIRALRQPVAINLFKQLLLGDEHVPGDAQTDKTMAAIFAADASEPINAKTWANWHSASPRAIQHSKFEALDRIAQSAVGIRALGHTESAALHPRYFFKIGCDGLVPRLLAPTRSNQPQHVLVSRALDYVPASLTHLHIDALEIAALTTGNGPVTWEEVTTVAATRVMDILHSMWSPREGRIYAGLSSNLAIRWKCASEAEQRSIREFYSRFRPDRFETHMRCEAAPDWAQIGIEADITSQQVHRLLLALVADPEFLVADRLEAWVSSLATAALSQYAKAWTDRYRTFGARVTPELMYWRAFDMLLFREEERDDLSDILRGALDVAKIEWSEQSLDRLRHARDAYQRAVAQTGLTLNAIASLIRGSSRVHKLVYQG